MKKVLVLGAQGMLGSEVVRVLEYLNVDKQIELHSTYRYTSAIPNQLSTQEYFDAKEFVFRNSGKYDWLRSFDYVVNCIGAIKQKYSETDESHLNNYCIANSLLPIAMNEFLKKSNTKVIQIATDCAFSGKKGNYTEQDEKDADDVYGRTKILGEVLSERYMHLRCSIVGFEKKTALSLLNWFLAQKQNVKGFTDHYWNGVSTSHFAKIVRAIILNDLFEAGIFHIVPANKVSKYDLLCLFQKYIGNKNIEIIPYETGTQIDRSLCTINIEKNDAFWHMLGYSMPPTIELLVSEIMKS